MSAGRNTDERLRYHLNARQADRERMCVALLAIDRAYSQIEPRLPEGGPDGGRDLQCIINGVKCFGAVGFKNDADDSDRQIREITSKFEGDLNSAIGAEPNLKAFVFFTNVNLPPATQEHLKTFARSKGISHVDIYWRERIRILLDNVEGFAIRNSFLDIALSDAEQKVFFSRFGSDIQNAITGGLDSIEKRIEELAFQNWCRGQCRSMNVVVKLKKLYQYKGADHEPFRFALRLHRVRMYGEGELYLGCCSEIRQREIAADYLVKEFHFIDSDLFAPNNKQKSVYPARQQSIGVGFSSVHFGMAFKPTNAISPEYGLRISDLKEYVVDFYCDAAWAEKVERVEVWYDHYLASEFVNDGRIERVRIVDEIPNWPQEYSDLSARPAEFWSGWPFILDRVCRRRRVGDHDF